MRRARVAYKALTAPLDPVNEGSFRALDVVIPEGNIMMARYPGADGGLEPRSSRRSSTPSSRRSAPAMPDRIPAAHHGLLGGAVVFFGVDPEDPAPLRRPEHRGRRLGRAADRGRRVGHGLGLPGRRAQRLDRGHRAEMPGAGRGRALRPDSGGAGQVTAAGSASTCTVENFVEGRWNFERTRAREMPALGHRRRQAPAIPRITFCACRRRTSSARSAARIDRCRCIAR